MAMTAKERKRAQKKRDDEAFARYGGRWLRFPAYGGTLAALERVCERQGYTGQRRYAQALTWLIHQNDDKVTTHEKESAE